jgi:hypothetical protein
VQLDATLHTFSEAEKQDGSGRFLEQWLGGQLDTKLSASAPPEASTLPARIIAGGYPEAFQRKPARARQWQAQYIQSLIKKMLTSVIATREESSMLSLSPSQNYPNSPPL